MPAPVSLTDLPEIIPIFPLQGALMLPGARLPLNIFEPRYLAMVDDALAGDRLIGMIQPKTPEQTVAGDHPEVYELGCAGRLTSYEETPDGRYLITLTGITRFSVAEELPLKNGYRQVRADFSPWSSDLEPVTGADIDRGHLAESLKKYLAARQLSADWDAIEKTPTEDLVSIVAMVCPFSPLEKQALLETPTLTDRAGLIISMLEMNSSGNPAPETVN